MKKNWLISESPDDEKFKLFEKYSINKVVGSVLYSRGIREKNELLSFLYPELNNLHSPFLLNGMYEAVARLRKAIEKKERIAIFADSDLDGITSLTILYDLLIKCGSIPDVRYPRDKEGYGLTCDIINEFISTGIKLLITVDSGIRDIDEIKYALENGIDTIITDHHEPDVNYPKAIIINPKMPGCLYPFKELAGVGVAMKLAYALLFSYTSGFNKEFRLITLCRDKISCYSVFNGIITGYLSFEENNLNEFILKHLTDDNHVICTNSIINKIEPIISVNNPKIRYNTLLGLSNTITGQNYDSEQDMIKNLLKKYNIHTAFQDDDQFFVKLFLELQMRSSRKLLERMQIYISLAAIGTVADIMPLYGENRNIIKFGLETLKHKKGHAGIQSLLNTDEPTTKNITWDIAPLLNTPGRFGETGLTVSFFLNNKNENITETIREIEKLNKERKKIVTVITEQIKAKIISDPNSDRQKIFYYSGTEIMSGLAGLIASRIADELKKPVIITVEESDPDLVKGSGRSYNDFNFFRFVEPFSEMFERIGGHAQAFGFTARKNKMNEIINAVNDAIGDKYENDETIKIDALIKIEEINSTLVDKISLLEPFGKNNEEPVFAAKGIFIESFSQFGSCGNHGKYILRNGLHAIGWNMTDKMRLFTERNAPVDIIFNLENNVYQNRKYPRLKIIDIDFS